MKKILWIDTETYGTTNLNRVGQDRYKEDVEIMLVSYALDDGPAKLWDLTRKEPMPEDLHSAIYDPENWVMASHNQPFDRTMCLQTNIFPDADLSNERWFCTLVQALAHGLPASLDVLGQVFGLEEDQAKSREGRRLIHLFCKPRNGKRTLPTDAPEQWEVFREYAVQDIVAMRAIHHKMPRWSYPGVGFLKGKPSAEFNMWLLDREINARGIKIDTDLCSKAIEQAEFAKESLDENTARITEGEVERATQRDKLLEFIHREYKITLPDLRADTLTRRIQDPNLPTELRQLLEIRIASGRNAASKFSAALEAVGPDGRLRNTLQFCGASTSGRWSGRIFQPQNLMNPTMPHSQIAEAIEDIKAGSAPYLWPNLAEVLGNTVRGVLTAEAGHKLIATDLGSVEARALAWLSGEQRVLRFFEDFDSGLIDYDGYMLAYADSFGVDPSTVTRDQREIGKPIDLAHGYGGGVAAFLNFAMVYRLDLQELAELVRSHADKAELQDCSNSYEYFKENGWHGGLPQFQFASFEYVKRRWRRAHPKTVQWWKDLAQAFSLSTKHEKRVFPAGPVQFRRDGQWMRLRLPSGRCLTFLQPRDEGGDLTSLGLDRYSRKWGRQFLHGGKLAGIVTQAFASDILRDAIVRLKEAQYPVVLTVHDEVITEVPDAPVFSVEEQVEIMTTPKPWAQGLPLVADGFEAYRYRKE